MCMASSIINNMAGHIFHKHGKIPRYTLPRVPDGRRTTVMPGIAQKDLTRALGASDKATRRACNKKFTTSRFREISWAFCALLPVLLHVHLPLLLAAAARNACARGLWRPSNSALKDRLREGPTQAC